MTDPNKTEKQLGAMLDHSADSEQLEQRFAQMRQRALDEIDTTPRVVPFKTRSMAYGAVAATVLSVAVLLTMNTSEELNIDQSLSEFAFIDSDDADMFTSDDPEFYLWLDEQSGEAS